MRCPAVFECDLARSLRPGPEDKRCDQVICCQCRSGRVRRALRGAGGQAGKAGQAVAGQAPAGRSCCRFVWLSGGIRAGCRGLGARASALAGIRGCLTSPAVCPGGAPVMPGFVAGACRQLPDRRPRQVAGPRVRPRCPPVPHQRDPGRTARHCRRPRPAWRPGPRLPARLRTPAATSPPDFVTRRWRSHRAGAAAPAAVAGTLFLLPPRPAGGTHAAGTHTGCAPGAVARRDEPAAAARRAPRTSARPVS
jgi:hypothetical protein